MNLDRREWSSIFVAFSTIQLAYVFGSRAQGAANSTSDIDIALVVREELLPFEEARLAANISRSTSVKKVDIAVLNHAPILLKYEAVANGQLIYQSATDDQLNQFEMSIYREYFDTEHIRNLQFESFFGEA